MSLARFFLFLREKMEWMRVFIEIWRCVEWKRHICGAHKRFSLKIPWDMTWARKFGGRNYPGQIVMVLGKGFGPEQEDSWAQVGKKVEGEKDRIGREGPHAREDFVRLGGLVDSGLHARGDQKKGLGPGFWTSPFSSGMRKFGPIINPPVSHVRNLTVSIVFFLFLFTQWPWCFSGPNLALSSSGLSEIYSK